MKLSDPEKLKSIGIPVAVLAAAFAALYYDVIAKMVNDWIIDDNYSHGFLIPPIAGYLIWQKKNELSKALGPPSNMGLLFLAGGLLVFLVPFTQGDAPPRVGACPGLAWGRAFGPSTSDVLCPSAPGRRSVLAALTPRSAR